MKTVVISQPMLFPWFGFFELMRQADVYVHLDDVEFSFGSFTNRIQIKTTKAIVWMTIPIQRGDGKPLIGTMEATQGPWRRKHRELVRQALAGAPHLDDALALFDQAYAKNRVADLLIDSIEGPASYLGLTLDRPMLASTLKLTSTGTQRVLDIVLKMGGTRYITAHGAADYLDHEAFERAGVAVEYIEYSKHPYPQLHGEFTPYVSVLDLIANCGPESRAKLGGSLIPWREFLARRSTPITEPN
jgi:hypothetical protein